MEGLSEDTVVTPLVRVLVDDIGVGGTYTRRQQRIVEEALSEGFTRPTVVARMVMIENDLRRVGIGVEFEKGDKQ